MEQELLMNVSVKPLAALNKSHSRLTSLHWPGLSTQGGRARLANTPRTEQRGGLHLHVLHIYLHLCYM